MDNEKNTPKKPIDNRPGKGPLSKGPAFNRSPISWLIIGLIVLTAMMMFSKMKNVEEISYMPDFIDYVEKGKIPRHTG